MITVVAGIQRLLSDDKPRDLLRVGGIVGAFAITDVLTRAIARVDSRTPSSAVLLWRAVSASPLPVGLLSAAFGLIWRFGRGSLVRSWSAIDRGTVLRWLAVPLVLLTSWELSLYEFNYLVGRWNGFDRFLLIGLAIGAWFRPVLLVAFVVEARVIAAQFVEPFGTTAGENIGELLLVALLVIAALHIVVAVTGESESASVMLVLGAAVATHYFSPGLAKARIGWLSGNEPGNLALNSYTSGWLGGGDGSWARNLAESSDRFAWVIVTGTIVAEVCAFIAVYSRRLLRWWLPMWAIFHIAVLVMSGFFLIGWVVLEITMLVVLVWPGSNDWLKGNDTPMRGLIAVVLVVVAGQTLFHPPKLAWFDSPIGYGYEVTAVGESGDIYGVPLTAFAPFQQELSFGFVQFRDRFDVVGGYGAASSKSLTDALKEIATFDDLASFEAKFDLTPADLRRRSETLLVRWFDAVNKRGDLALVPLLSPPTRFLTSSKNPTYHFQEPLRSASVVQVVSIHHGDTPTTMRTKLLTVAKDASGRAEIVERFDG
jgi:hypothetical protein